MITNIKNTTEAGLGAKPNKIKEMDFIQVLNLLESLTARYNKLAAAAKDAFSRSNGDDPAMQIIASELDEQGQLQKRESAQHTKNQYIKNTTEAGLGAKPNKVKDAHCLECGFQMINGADVGLCPRCGSDRWYEFTVANANPNPFPKGRWS